MADSARQETTVSTGYLDYDYDRFYSHHDFDYVERVETAFLTVILRGLAKLPDGACVVDVGCGTGFDTWLMDRMGYRAVGVDTSQVAIEKARQRPGGAQFVHGDALTLHDELGCDFDLVYCSGLMAFNWVDSLQEPGALHAARALLGYLRPGGRLVFVWDSILSGRRWSPYADVQPDRMFMNYSLAQVRGLWNAVDNCRIRHAGITHKRLAPLLGRGAFSLPVQLTLSATARSLRRPAQIVVVVQRGGGSKR